MICILIQTFHTEDKLYEMVGADTLWFHVLNQSYSEQEIQYILTIE